MNLLLTNYWLLWINSIVFWLAPIALVINLVIVKNKPHSYQQKIGYFYGSLWAIALTVYWAISLVTS